MKIGGRDAGGQDHVHDRVRSKRQARPRLEQRELRPVVAVEFFLLAERGVGPAQVLDRDLFRSRVEGRKSGVQLVVVTEHGVDREASGIGDVGGWVGQRDVGRCHALSHTEVPAERGGVLELGAAAAPALKSGAEQDAVDERGVFLEECQQRSRAGVGIGDLAKDRLKQAVRAGFGYALLSRHTHLQ